MFANKLFKAARVCKNARVLTTLYRPQIRYFSNVEENDVRSQVISNSEKMEFKAETRKLLDIVAKSIYTDKEVFVRELLSNCSDALEKQRYAEISGASKSNAGDHFIEMVTNDQERTLTIFDSGIGMDRD